VAVRHAIIDALKQGVQSKPAAGALHSTAIQIKWPNDVLINDHKIAGILCEQFTLPRGRLPSFPNSEETRPSGALIVGVGVNVDFDLALLGAPATLRHPATTLAQATNLSLSVEGVINAISERLIESLEAFEREGLSQRLLADLRQHLAYVGDLKTWTSPRAMVTGRILGIDDFGRLMLQTEHGVEACDVGEL